MNRKTLSQYAYAKRKGVSRQYISKLVKDGRIHLIDGMVDPDQADTVLDETWHPRRKDDLIRHLLNEAFQNFAYFAGQNGLDGDRVCEVAMKYMNHDEFDKYLKRFGHPGLDSYEVQLNGEWGPPDYSELMIGRG